MVVFFFYVLKEKVISMLLAELFLGHCAWYEISLANANTYSDAPPCFCCEENKQQLHPLAGTALLTTLVLPTDLLYNRKNKKTKPN